MDTHLDNNELGTSLSKEDKESILNQRANEIALVQRKNSVEGKLNEVVIFFLEQEMYAIEAIFVKEVYPLIDVTILPCVPPWVYGVINVRRRIYSVIDLKSLFGLPRQEDKRDYKVIILEQGCASFGILTDEIYGVKSIEIDRLQSQLPTQTHKSKEYFKGITNDRIIVLNGSKLLHSDGLIVDEVVN